VRQLRRLNNLPVVITQSEDQFVVRRHRLKQTVHLAKGTRQGEQNTTDEMETKPQRSARLTLPLALVEHFHSILAGRGIVSGTLHAFLHRAPLKLAGVHIRGRG
jgi:hypothetical protein